MSVEGQTFGIKQQGNLSSLKKVPAYPKGFDPDKVKLWVPNFEQYVALHKDWVEAWNKTYNYRQ
jgi:iron(III) transport system substrate-binding protein